MLQARQIEFILLILILINAIIFKKIYQIETLPLIANFAAEIHHDSYSDNSSSINICNKYRELFSCERDGICIFSKFVCDGECHCNGCEDEENCIQYENWFEKDVGLKLINFRLPMSQGQQVTELVIKNVHTAESCAKICFHRTSCTCTSFSFNEQLKTCIISDNSLNTIDVLLERRNWNYYLEKSDGLDESIIGIRNHVRNCRLRTIGYKEDLEAIRGFNAYVDYKLIDVKINGDWGGICYDGHSINESHVLCKQLGYKLGAYSHRGVDLYAYNEKLKSRNKNGENTEPINILP